MHTALRRQTKASSLQNSPSHWYLMLVFPHPLLLESITVSMFLFSLHISLSIFFSLSLLLPTMNEITKQNIVHAAIDFSWRCSSVSVCRLRMHFNCTTGTAQSSTSNSAYDLTTAMYLRTMSYLVGCSPILPFSFRCLPETSAPDRCG